MFEMPCQRQTAISSRFFLFITFLFLRIAFSARNEIWKVIEKRDIVLAYHLQRREREHDSTVLNSMVCMYTLHYPQHRHYKWLNRMWLCPLFVNVEWLPPWLGHFRSSNLNVSTRRRKIILMIIIVYRCCCRNEQCSCPFTWSPWYHSIYLGASGSAPITQVRLIVLPLSTYRSGPLRIRAVGSVDEVNEQLNMTMIILAWLCIKRHAMRKKYKNSHIFVKWMSLNHEVNCGQSQTHASLNF